MTRRGLNCSLTYTRDGIRHGYRVRVKRLTHGFQMVADESQARLRRAFYPHQTAPTQFGIQVDLIGAAERQSLNGWLMTYVNYILDPAVRGKSTPQMTVQVPSRNFKRVGVPISGFEFGDHLGSMVFSPTLIFETSGEPIDWDEKFATSRVFDDLARARSKATEFFYPTGTQLSGDAAPTSLQQVVNGDPPLTGIGNPDDGVAGGTF